MTYCLLPRADHNWVLFRQFDVILTIKKYRDGRLPFAIPFSLCPDTQDTRAYILDLASKNFVIELLTTALQHLLFIKVTSFRCEGILPIFKESILPLLLEIALFSGCTPTKIGQILSARNGS